MKLKFNFAFFLFPIVLTSQITFSNPEGQAISFLTKNKDYSDEKTEGSPYLDEIFEKGEVYVYDTLEIKGDLRYNAYRSEIEVSENEKSYFSLLKRPYITAEIGDRLFKMFNYTDDRERNRVAYFNPMNEGNIVLLFKPDIKLRKGKVPATNYDRYVPPTYIDVSSYYLKKGKEPAKKIRLNKKTLITYLKDKKESVTAFIKDKGLNLSKEEDTVTLLDYYNSL